MLQTDGIPPKLTNQVCEELICQQYWYEGKLAQEVDGLFLKVNGRWHQLYFDSDIVFWRIQQEAPKSYEARPDDPFVYRLVDVGEKYAVQDCVIADCITEPSVDGVRVLVSFENKGSLIVMHSENKTSLRFINSAWV